MTVGHLFKYPGEIGIRFDTIYSASAYDASHDNPVATSNLGTGEECILSQQSDWPNSVLNGVAVKFDPAIV